MRVPMFMHIPTCNWAQVILTLKSGHGEIQILTYISIRALYVMVI